MTQDNTPAGDLTVVAAVPDSEAGHFNGSNICMIPFSEKAAAGRGGDHTPGQYAHCHCLMSPDGKILIYNRVRKLRSDVYLLPLE